MTQQEVIYRIEQNDLDFVIRLIIDNNATAVKDNLAQEGLGLDLPANYTNEQLYSVVKELEVQGKGDQLYRVLAVPYSEGSQFPYTNNLSAYIEQREREGVTLREGGAFLNTWGPVIGTVLTTAGLLLTGTNATTSDSGTGQGTDENVETKKDEDKILGISKPLFFGGLILITALAFVLILKRGGK